MQPPSLLTPLSALVVLAAASAAHGETGFDGTAYLKTRNTVLLAGRDRGLARAGAEALIGQCNDFRRLNYHLGPVSPGESVLAALEVSVHEKYLDHDKALSVVTTTHLTLTDMQRWVGQLKSSATGALPAVPPDCAQVDTVERRNGTLWRDGVVYELRYDTRKALGRRAPAPRPGFLSPADFLNLAPGRELDQSCREVSGGPGVAPESHACIWDLFPYRQHLNWPFALSGRIQFGPTPAMFETIVPVEARHGQVIPASTFEIPSGFVVTPP